MYCLSSEPMVRKRFPSIFLMIGSRVKHQVLRLLDDDTLRNTGHHILLLLRLCVPVATLRSSHPPAWEALGYPCCEPTPSCCIRPMVSSITHSSVIKPPLMRN